MVIYPEVQVLGRRENLISAGEAVAIKFHIIPLMDLALFSLELSKLSEIP
jgi:hypothetical protein